MPDLDYSKLRGRITEIFGSQSKFSKEIGLSEQSITAKLNKRSMFTQNDIIKWSLALRINTADIGLYFFNQDFQNVK